MFQSPEHRSRLGIGSLIFAAALTGGVFLARCGAPSARTILPPLVILAFALPLGPGAGGRLRTAVSQRARILLPAIVLGALSSAWYDRRDPGPALLRSLESFGFEAYRTPVELRGRLLETTRHPDGRARLTLRAESLRIPGACAIEPGDALRPVLRLSIPDPGTDTTLPWQAGDELALTARFGPPQTYRNPGAFDHAAYLRVRGIDLTGSVKSGRLVQRSGAPRHFFSNLIPRLRRRVLQRLDAAAGPGGAAASGFLSALLLGDRSRLSPAAVEDLRGAGIYHVVALSGLHVGVIVLLLGAIGRIGPLPPPLQRVTIILGAVFYGLLAHEASSIARAVAMATVYFVGGLLGRRIAPLGAIGVCATLLLLYRPAWAADAGFQLTFAATIAIVAGVSSARRKRSASRRPDRQRWRRGIGALRVSAWALFATTPLTAMHFHTMTPVAVLSNLLAVPLAGLLLIIGLLMVGLQPFAPVPAGALAILAGTLIDRLLAIARALGDPGIGSFHVLPPGPGLTAWCALGVLLATLASSRALRKGALATAFVTMLWIAGNGRSNQRPSGSLEITVLDVGQGDAVLVRFPNGLRMLIDAGDLTHSGFDVGARVVAPSLRALGTLDLDILVVTHAHRDHLGGAASIMRQFSPRAVWLGALPDVRTGMVKRLIELAEEGDAPVVFPRRGVHLVLGDAIVEVLNPATSPTGRRSSGNEHSLVLRIVLRQRAALLTGDIERTTELELVDLRLPLRADLLKVGHHGSGTSTSERFLDRVAPSVALISTGRRNAWGHPHPDVLDRLHSAGTVIRRTDLEGAVRYATDGGSAWNEKPLPGRPGQARGVRTPGPSADCGR